MKTGLYFAFSVISAIPLPALEPRNTTIEDLATGNFKADRDWCPTKLCNWSAGSAWIIYKSANEAERCECDLNNDGGYHCVPQEYDIGDFNTLISQPRPTVKDGKQGLTIPYNGKAIVVPIPHPQLDQSDSEAEAAQKQDSGEPIFVGDMEAGFDPTSDLNASGGKDGATIGNDWRKANFKLKEYCTANADSKFTRADVGSNLLYLCDCGRGTTFESDDGTCTKSTIKSSKPNKPCSDKVQIGTANGVEAVMSPNDSSGNCQIYVEGEKSDWKDKDITMQVRGHLA